MGDGRSAMRIGIGLLVVAATGLAVIGASGGTGGPSVGVLLGTIGPTVVLFAGLGILFTVILGGGIWAYRRTTGPVPQDEAMSEDEKDMGPGAFAGYESFEAFVAANGLMEFRQEHVQESSHADRGARDRDSSATETSAGDGLEG